MALIKLLSELKKLTNLSRAEVYKQTKATIDAANKRLKRQGVDTKLSTTGKDANQLIETAKQALNVPVQNRSAKPRQTVPKQPRQPRQTKVRQQLPDGFTTMKRDELAKAMQPTIDAANKRLKRLQGMNTLSPALNAVMENGGNFSLRGKNRNEVLKEASRAISFINMKTSTVSGAKSFEANFARKLSNKSQNISNDQRKVLFDAFRKLEQMSPVGLNVYGSDKLVRMLADEVVDEKFSFEQTMQRALNELNREYEQFQRENDDLNPFDLLKKV